MQKSEWKFTYKASDLAAGAKAKKATTETKFNWWEEVRKKLMLSLPDSLQVVDSSASSYSSIKGGFGPQVSIDPKLQLQLNEAHQRLIQLDQTIREYDGWIQVLEANSTQSLELNHADWLFFFGAESKSRIAQTTEE